MAEGDDRPRGDLEAAIREALGREAALMLELVPRCEAAIGRDAGRGSLAVADRSWAPEPSERPLGRHPLTLGSTALAVAGDHLRTWVLVMRVGPMPIYAAYTLLRAAIETAALCRWLVDPSETSEERVARGAAALLEDHRQRQSFEGSFGAAGERTSGKSGADRYTEHVADRDAAGIRRIEVPGATKMLLDYGPPDDAHGRDWPYRLASAFAHGHSWSLLVSTLGEGMPVAGGIRRGRVSASEGAQLLIATKAREGVELAVADLEAYMRRGERGSNGW